MRILLTADWHIRSQKPLCRLDEDWMAYQYQRMMEVCKIAEEHHVDETWIAGDLFDTPVVSTEAMAITAKALNKFPGVVKFIAGNHDLPQHSTENYDKSAVGLFRNFFENPSDMEGWCSAADFGIEPSKQAEVVVTHQLVFPTEQAKVGDAGKTAQELLDEFPMASVIVTGDYHDGYIYENEGRHVVTPGCLMAQKSDKKNYKCFVVIWDVDACDFRKIYLIDESSLVTTDHIEAAAKKDSLVESIIESVKTECETLNFDENLENAVKSSKDEHILEVYSGMRTKCNL